MTVPVEPDADTARRWLEDELAKADYSEMTLLQRLNEWFAKLWEGVDPGAATRGLGSVIVTVLIAGALALLLWILVRWRRRHRLTRGTTSVEAPQVATVGDLVDPAEHRRRAQEALADGRFDEAVVERFRAVVAVLVERDWVIATAGLTSQEAADAASVRLPGLAADLRRAANLFDHARYGHGLAGVRELGTEDVDVIAVLDERVSVSREHEADSVSREHGAEPMGASR